MVDWWTGASEPAWWALRLGCRIFTSKTKHVLRFRCRHSRPLKKSFEPASSSRAGQGNVWWEPAEPTFSAENPTTTFVVNALDCKKHERRAQQCANDEVVSSTCATKVALQGGRSRTLLPTPGSKTLTHPERAPLPLSSLYPPSRPPQP